MKTNQPSPPQARRRKSSSQELSLLPIAGPQGSFQRRRIKNQPGSLQPQTQATKKFHVEYFADRTSPTRPTNMGGP